jgi:amino acid transporter
MATEAIERQGGGLRRNAIGFPGVMMQSITHISPAIAALFFTQFVVSKAGEAAPLAYLVGVIVVLMLGVTLAQMAKILPSSGGYYTYVSRGVHPRAGFLTSWMYVLYSPLCGGAIYAFFGYTLNSVLQTFYKYDLPWLWWVCVLVGAPLVAFAQHRGIELSTKILVALGSLEMIIVFVLGIWGLARPGTGGFTFGVFDFSKKASFEGFALAIVFSVQGLTGWEAAAPLAEESRDPRKNVPRALVWSIVLLGIFLVLMYWGQIIGYGVKNLSGLTNATVLPGITLARKYWGGGYVVILIAFFNSVLAVCLATANVGTRMWYRMGQSGTLPPTFAVVHPKYKTPTTAILVQLALSLATGIGVGLWLGASNSYFLIDGLILVIACVVIYIMGNLACFMLYWRTRREHFNVFMHLIFPIISSAALIYALIKSFPVSYPFNLAPWIDGVWLVIGIGVLVYFKVRGNETWLLKAGRALGEEDEPSLDDARPAEASRTPREGQ